MLSVDGELFIGQLSLQLHLHFMAHQIDLRWVDVGVHVLALGNRRLSFDMLVRKVVWHACLAVRHVDLKGSVASLSIQDHLHFLRMLRLLLLFLLFIRHT